MSLKKNHVRCYIISLWRQMETNAEDSKIYKKEKINNNTFFFIPQHIGKCSKGLLQLVVNLTWCRVEWRILLLINNCDKFTVWLNIQMEEFQNLWWYPTLWVQNRKAFPASLQHNVLWASRVSLVSIQSHCNACLSSLFYSCHLIGSCLIPLIVLVYSSLFISIFLYSKYVSIIVMSCDIIYLQAYLHIGNQLIYRDQVWGLRGKNKWTHSPNHQMNSHHGSCLLILYQIGPWKTCMELEKQMEEIH